MKEMRIQKQKKMEKEDQQTNQQKYAQEKMEGETFAGGCFGAAEQLICAECEQTV